MAITKIQSESLNLADTYAFTGTVTGAGGVNTPSFFVRKTSSQTISDQTSTKITWNSEIYDTASAFASDKFTVPSGQAGTYQLYAQAAMGNANGSATNLYDHYLFIYKNGSGIIFSDHNPNANWWAQNTSYVSLITDLAVGDYIEMYAYINVGAGDGRIGQIDGGRIKSFLYGYKLIGA